MDHPSFFIQALVLCFLCHQVIALLQLRAFTHLCHDNRPRHKALTAATLFTWHAQSHLTSDSASSSSKESLAFLLPKSAKPHFICMLP